MDFGVILEVNENRRVWGRKNIFEFVNGAGGVLQLGRTV
jgi:hypothetical protein